MNSLSSPSSSRPALRLFREDEAEPTSRESAGGVSPRMPLSRFFHEWYVPVALRGRSAGTIKAYGESIAWWVRLTGDPPLVQIDEYTLIAFADRLSQATFRRGTLGSEWPVRAHTAAKHARTINTILAAAGPKRSRNRPSKGLLDDVPSIPASRPEVTRKPVFTPIDMRELMRAANGATRPLVTPVAPWEWWRGFAAFLFGLGERAGTIWRLEWSMLRESAGGWEIDLPSELVPKTGKGGVRWIADWVAASVAGWPRRSDRIFECGLKMHAIRERHEAIQRDAGFARPLELQAWRRTHAEQMGLLGLDQATELMRATLNHSSARTTTAHYADLANIVRRRLACPWGDVPTPPQRSLLC